MLNITRNHTFKAVYCVTPLVLLLSSCGIFAPISTPEMHSYQIDSTINTSSKICTMPVNDAILQITPMRADAPYDNIKMLYSENQYEVSDYSLNQWASPPQQMITQAITDTLDQSCLYKTVVGASFMTYSNYRLNTQLLELKQTIVSESTSVVSLKVFTQLVNNSTNQVVKNTTFNESATVNANPTGFVMGANLATKQLLTDMVAWLEGK